MTFDQFFHQATEQCPYPYQAELAESDNLVKLLRIPTGTGKTEAAILGWMYRRFYHPDSEARDGTPRRLVYCLPMRALVEQTEKRVQEWLGNLDMTGDVGVVVLMGGEPRTQWYLEPEKPTIVIGTQDMLLSRALNRGYGSSPFMWPVEYGLLNNDCLWVMDEVQIMANGLATSNQLAGLRRKLKTFGPAASMWMSATAKAQWLETIDHPAPAEVEVMELGDADMENSNLSKRHRARKVVSELSKPQRYARDMAEFIVNNHKAGTLTLAIVNTVERAQDMYKALNNPRWVSTDAETMLIHSRFRGNDRAQQREWLGGKTDKSGPGKVVVATQAVEAGVDISARTLITELAPWASMVQRFGRCNREGKYEEGEIFWVDFGERKQDAAPYEPEDVEESRKLMKDLEGESAGPSDIEKLDGVMRDADHPTVIRRRDVEGLFDTTPDLSGGYLDVSQYVRGIDERNVSVFWRNVEQGGPGDSEPKPNHEEIVSVPLGAKGINDYLKDSERRAWRWDFLDDRWAEIYSRDVHPGMTLMLDAKRGGYSSETGWDISAKDAVEITEEYTGEQEDGQGLDPNSTSQGRWVRLSEHSRNVERAVDKVLAASDWIDDADIREAVRVAALHHDVGKAHEAFQKMLRESLPEGESPYDEDVYMAKSPGKGRNERRHFRHELGSALAVLEHAEGLEDRYRDLAAYLAAAHHGKIRLGIRSLPGRRERNRDSNPDAGYLLGYKTSETETLPSVDLGEGVGVGETALDMSIAQIGLDDGERRSWLERSLGLLEWLGPFRLAYLEAIVRAADMRASEKERENAQ
ncbi:MAG: CRISPR-associated helicase Cas3' [Dehalococcoidia bacterium]|nr:CRISPR-associated helicase Cas3' [Dehalococcoidia bacterium]